MYKQTGMMSGKPQHSVIFSESLRTYAWSVTGPFEPLHLIMQQFKGLFVKCGVFGALLALENPVEHGMKQDLMLTVRIPEANFGMAISLNSMLSLMNFEEVSTYPIYLDGVTGILFVWKSKDPLSHYWQPRFGLHPISTQGIGTRTLIKKLWMHYFEDLI